MNDLLKRLRESNIHVAVRDGQLKISFDGELDQKMLDELRQNKEQLLAYLSSKDASQSEFEPITRAENSETYPVSSAQKRLWVICQLEEVNVAYNEHKLEIIRGDLDVTFLEKVCNTMISRYEIFRTGFIEGEEGEPVQQIAEASSIDFKIDVIDKGELSGADPKDYLKKYLSVPFDLSTGPLFRLLAIEVEEGQWVLCFVIHHIICDGWSFELMIKEFRELFMAGDKMSEDILPSLSIQYRDYAVWQREQLESAEMDTHRKYWLDHFSDEIPVLELPTDFTRPAFKTFNGDRIRTWINAELSQGIRKLSQETGATLYMGLLATVNALFYRYTGQTDLVFGSPIAGREHPDLENQLGFFLNTLVLRTTFDQGDSFKHLLLNVKESALDAYQHQDYPFDDLVTETEKNFDKSRNPMFDVMVGLLNTKVGANHADVNEPVPTTEAGSEEQNDGIDLTISKFDLTFNFTEKNGGIYLGLEYNTDLFRASTIQRMVDHYQVLLESIVDSPESAISELNCIPQDEENKLMELSGTANYEGTDDSVVKRFHKVASLNPDKKAVCFDEVCMTYKELNEISDLLSVFLYSEHQLGKNDISALLLPRGEWQVVAQMAIMKTGAAFLPLDVTHPEERIQQILESSNTKVVIDQKMIQDFLNKKSSLRKNDEEFISNDSADAMYVIYTSGSTGRPKGVVIEHHSVLNLVDAYGLETGLNSSLTTNYTFDVSILEIYSALLSGGTLYLPDAETVVDPNDFTAFLCDNKVEHAYVHPMLLKEMAESLEAVSKELTLKRILTGVQKVRYEDVQWYVQNGIRVINGYGPTETTVCATFYEVNKELKPESQLPIGCPVDGNALYIVDESGQLAGLGMVGELSISGQGVARGYLNNQDMTDECFIDNPFGKGMLYRTGDYGRWLEDGNIEFIGRRDGQVKISGYRIETGEIENALDAIEFVGQNAVVAKNDALGETVLVGYVVVENGSTEQQLLDALRARIPEYMIPTRFMNVLELPMTANGKVDKRALPEPEDLGVNPVVPYVEPRNEIEEQLVEIWNNLLGADKIGVKDNFFHLGGNSLKAIRLISQINKHFGLKYDLKGVYSESSIEAIAEKIRVDRWFKEDAGSHEDYTEIKI